MLNETPSWDFVQKCIPTHFKVFISGEFICWLVNWNWVSSLLSVKTCRRRQKSHHRQRCMKYFKNPPVNSFFVDEYYIMATKWTVHRSKTQSIKSFLATEFSITILEVKHLQEIGFRSNTECIIFAIFRET